MRTQKRKQQNKGKRKGKRKGRDRAREREGKEEDNYSSYLGKVPPAGCASSTAIDFVFAFLWLMFWRPVMAIRGNLKNCSTATRSHNSLRSVILILSLLVSAPAGGFFWGCKKAHLVWNLN